MSKSREDFKQVCLSNGFVDKNDRPTMLSAFMERKVGSSSIVWVMRNDGRHSFYILVSNDGVEASMGLPTPKDEVDLSSLLRASIDFLIVLEGLVGRAEAVIAQ